jgi:polyisoprenoid-binding protein YceI
METNWKVDSMHSEVGFKVRHMMISNVSGSFGSFDANVLTNGDDFSEAKFDFSAAIDSINTGVADRDGHLKSGDFFDAENHPALKFTSTDVKKVADDALEIAGNLEIRGTVKPVVLKAEFAGIAVDPYGQTKAGMTVTGTIKRSEFGLTWSAVTEAGNIVVGDDIKLSAELQFIKQ